MLKKIVKYFSIIEWIIWLTSVSTITALFIIFKNKQFLYLAGAIVGVTSLIFDSKGNVVGQFIGLAFDILYSIISYKFAYYGEMITYLGLAAPQAILSIVSWMRHPFNGDKKEVEINVVKPFEYVLLTIISLFITFIFYFILKYLNTENLILSTVSIFTSCVATYLLIRRDKWYTIAFCFNDCILIGLWVLASTTSSVYYPMVACFLFYFVIDIYSFINWTKILNKQRSLRKK